MMMRRLLGLNANAFEPIPAILQLSRWRGHLSHRQQRLRVACNIQSSHLTQSGLRQINLAVLPRGICLCVLSAAIVVSKRQSRLFKQPPGLSNVEGRGRFSLQEELPRPTELETHARPRVSWCLRIAQGLLDHHAHNPASTPQRRIVTLVSKTISPRG